MHLLMPSSAFNSKLDCIIATSPTFQDIFASAFGLSKDQIPITGYPRNDIFFKPIPGSNIGTDEALKEQINKSKKSGSKIVLYAPTFRDTEADLFMKDTLTLLSKINNYSKQKNILFIFKPHENSAHILRRSLADVSLDNVFVSHPESDIYPILSQIDVLITDYSSIFTDFLLLNRPIVFFPYDIEKYKDKDREFYFDYDEFTPGPKAYTFDELLIAVDGIFTKDSYCEKRKIILDKSFTYKDANASKRVANFVELVF